MEVCLCLTQPISICLPIDGSQPERMLGQASSVDIGLIPSW